MDAWDDVLRRLDHATGHDRQLDHAIAGVLEAAGIGPETGRSRAFTASVSAGLSGPRFEPVEAAAL